MFSNFSTFNTIPNTICEDELCGFIDINASGHKEYHERSDYAQTFVPSASALRYCQINPPPFPLGKFIYIGMESPHIEEFQINPISCFATANLIHCRPAVGKTGSLFKDKIVLKIGNFLNEHAPISLPVIKFNIVQIQCSAGRPTKFYRDENFVKALFDRSIQMHNNSLIQRLKSINPGYFFNCCTKGNPNTIKEAVTALNHQSNGPFELRSLIEPIIQSNIPTGTFYRRLNQHPSQWWL